MGKIIVEVCCGTAAEAYHARNAGADRVELNSALSLGGISPSIGAVRLVKKAGIRSMVMIRPRSGDFCYSQAEFETMKADAIALREEGVEGAVFGILNPNRTVDRKRCRELMEILGGMETVFHKAFDETADWQGTLDTLVDLGVTRILTGGLQARADDGVPIIREMIAKAAGRIEILCGGGIRKDNVRRIIEATGCGQVHFSMRKTEDRFFTGTELRDLIGCARDAGPD
ncbi:MAG: copper homeostasis protein CutC [Spirochaetaceae bacterium]|jgi:copper homeostasis protein|nr:copper homeostasis protein CutC [Spirochaetaceae bacterium]